MSRVKVVDEETGEIGYIDDEDENVPFQPASQSTETSATPDFVTQEAPFGLSATPDFVMQEPQVATPRQTRSTVPFSQQPHNEPAPGGVPRRQFTPGEDNTIHPEEAFARAGGQALTYGYQDELSARLSDLMSEGDTYETDLGLLRDENQEATQAQPAASGFGTALGSLAGPSGGARLGGRILAGAAQGALAGRGYSEAEDPTDDMVRGGIMGGAFPAASAAITPVARWMTWIGSDLAGPVSKRFRARVPGEVPEEIAGSVEKTEAYGGELQRLGIGDRPWSNSRQAAEDARQSLERTSPEFDTLHSKMDAAGARATLSPNQIEDAIRILGPMEPKSRNNGLFRRSMDALRNAEPPPPPPMPSAPPSAPRSPLDGYGRRLRAAAAEDATAADLTTPRSHLPATERSPVRRPPPPTDTAATPPLPRSPVRRKPTSRPTDAAATPREYIDTPTRLRQADLAAAAEQFMQRELRAPTFRQAHDIRMALDDVVDPTSERVLKRETGELRGEISDVMQDAAERHGFGPDWTSANRDYRGAATAARSARQGNRELTNNPESGFARALLTGAVVGMAPTAINAASSNDGGMSFSGGGGSVMSGLGTTAVLMAARGRSPRIAEAFSSVGGSALSGVGRGVEAAARMSTAPITRFTESRRQAALNPDVARILDEALASDQDPAVTNFLLQSDEDIRRAGVEEDP